MHVPLDETTRHLLREENLARVLLVNSARGAVVDNRALLAVLAGGRLPAAVLDTWENEPAIPAALLERVALGTPHIAGYSLDGKVNGTRLIHEAFCRFFKQAVPLPQFTLPPPAVPLLRLQPAAGADDEDTLHAVIRRVYDITADDAALRQDVRSFDRLRADYPVRREFGNTRIELTGGSPTLPRMLRELGFAV